MSMVDVDETLDLGAARRMHSLGAGFSRCHDCKRVIQLGEGSEIFEIEIDEKPLYVIKHREGGCPQTLRLEF